MTVNQQVADDAEQPGAEGQAAGLIAREGFERAMEGLGSEVLGVAVVSEPAIGEPVRPETAAGEGTTETPLDPGEVAAAADAAAEAEDFDDEGSLSLAAMEASLKPQMLEKLDQIASLYKRLGRLQDASVEAALASDELSSGQERRYKKLRAETVDLVKGLKLNNNRIEALVDQMYGINRRLLSLEGQDSHSR